MKDPESKAKASKAVMAALDGWYEKIPGFEDVFTETSFYIFALVFTLLSIAGEVLASKHISLKDRGER